ncbi:MAG: TetR/AcrR family transcriptional regulator [Deltaproteobacteria bacterium]|nr:TetR/AcrR family transcriptional regulator [Deltaproteobacteria bacterium]
MGRPARRQREIERTRRDILEAAAEVFGTKGYESATIQDIADHVGYSAAALYNYFEGKQAIFEGLVRLIEAEIAELLDFSGPPGLPFAEHLDLMLRHQFEFADRRRGAFLVMLRLGVVDSALLPSSQGSIDRTEFSIRCFERLFEQHAQALGNHPPRQAAIMLGGVVHAFFLDWLKSGSPARLAEATPVIVDFFLRGLGAGAVSEVQNA